MTITFNNGTTVTLADDSSARSGASGLKSKAEGNVQEAPAVGRDMPSIEGLGNNKRVVTFSSKRQFSTPELALAYWETVSDDLPGTHGTLTIGGHSHWAACRAVESEPMGVKVVSSFEFVIGSEPA